MTITKNELWDIAKKLKAARQVPRKVQDQEEAQLLTEADPVGHKWTIGEEYYIVFAPTGKCEY